jgi:hypothetical protein
MDGLAERAGLGKGTVFRRFGTTGAFELVRRFIKVGVAPGPVSYREPAGL